MILEALNVYSSKFNLTPEVFGQKDVQTVSQETVLQILAIQDREISAIVNITPDKVFVLKTQQEVQPYAGTVSFLPVLFYTAHALGLVDVLALLDLLNGEHMPNVFEGIKRLLQKCGVQYVENLDSIEIDSVVITATLTITVTTSEVEYRRTIPGIADLFKDLARLCPSVASALPLDVVEAGDLLDVPDADSGDPFGDDFGGTDDFNMSEDFDTLGSIDDATDLPMDNSPYNLFSVLSVLYSEAAAYSDVGDSAVFAFPKVGLLSIKDEGVGFRLVGPDIDTVYSHDYQGYARAIRDIQRVSTQSQKLSERANAEKYKRLF